MLLKDTDILEVITDAACDLDFWCSFTDRNSDGSSFPPSNQQGNITTATTTTIIAAPASGETRWIQSAYIRNAHATNAVNVTVEVNRSSGTLRECYKYNLLAGETLEFTEALGFHVPTAIFTAASQAEQETGTATNRYVSPATQQYHQSAVKAWGKITVSGGTPTLAVSYNTTSITDTATDQVTVTINNDFSSANYALTVSIEAATTTLSATTTSLAVFIRNATQLAGSFIIQACEFDVGAATDPSAWHYQCCGDL